MSQISVRSTIECEDYHTRINSVYSLLDLIAQVHVRLAYTHNSQV